MRRFASTAASRCPVTRAMLEKLRYRATSHRITGEVTSASSACEGRHKVALYQVRKGRDRQVKARSARALGDVRA